MNLSLVGLFASLWLVVGVYMAGRNYPNYNHAKQFLSELGASESPTQKLSPIINNFPLSLLFMTFGIYLLNSTGFIFIGCCIIFHGIGTLVAGVFPMDLDPHTTSPTVSCKIHSTAGLVMFISLLAASSFAAFSASFGLTFKAISAVATLFTVYFTFKLFKEFTRKGNVGLYQRLSYGCQLIWLSFLSIFLFSAN
jgi:hypothetical membrane protein